jgi:hypothetical protein
MDEQMLAPIELTDDELLAVSGGQTTVAGVVQAIQQEAVVVQQGGSVVSGGTVIETFVAAITQVATNVNTGDVNVDVTV